MEADEGSADTAIDAATGEVEEGVNVSSSSYSSSISAPNSILKKTRAAAAAEATTPKTRLCVGNMTPDVLYRRWRTVSERYLIIDFLCRA